jgi:hypothetical protein
MYNDLFNINIQKNPQFLEGLLVYFLNLETKFLMCGPATTPTTTPNKKCHCRINANCSMFEWVFSEKMQNAH